jgi:hypothetical protein
MMETILKEKGNDITLFIHEKTIKSTKKKLMPKCAETARMFSGSAIHSV